MAFSSGSTSTAATSLVPLDEAASSPPDGAAEGLVVLGEELSPHPASKSPALSAAVGTQTSL
jgi:hypothetical protein